MVHIDWAYICMYASLRMRTRKFLRSILRDAYRFCKVCGGIQEKDRQREYDLMRVGPSEDMHPRQLGMLITRPLAGLDLKMIHPGFIKVDGVYRDARYYISHFRLHTRPDRIELKQAPVFPIKIFVETLEMLHVLDEEEIPLTWTSGIRWDRPFTEWEE